MAVALLIPAYRPDTALRAVVEEVLSLGDSGLIDHVIVVDDGSGPAFRSTFDQLRLLGRVSVLTLAANGGKGAALRAGLREGLSGSTVLTGIVTADADGQHAPHDILRIARALVDRPDSLVLGARGFDGRIPFRSLVGNAAMSGLVRWRTGRALTDTQTGLRGWPLSWVPALLEVTGDRYDWELRALLSAITRPIVEIPIATIYSGQKSHFRPLRDSVTVCRALLKPVRFPERV